MSDKSIRRWRKHVANLNRILKDTRIHGSRRILAQVLAMWMDADSDEDKRVLTLVLLGTFGPNLRGVRWQEPDEEPIGVNDANTKVDIEARTHIKNLFAEIMEDDAVPE